MIDRSPAPWPLAPVALFPVPAKGDPLYVEGRLQYRSFEDEEGKERGTCEIVADDVQFLSRRSNGSRGEPEA